MAKKWDKIKNQVHGNSGIFSIGSTDIIGTGISSFLWFLLPTFLSSEEYGEIHFVLSIAGIAYTFCLIGNRDVITVFTSKSFNLNSTLYFFSLISSLVAIIIIFLIFQIDSIIIILAFVINDLGLGYLLGKKFYKQYPFYIIIQKSLALVLCLSFYFIFGPEGILFGLALSYLHFTILIYQGFKDSKINLNSLKLHREFIFNNYILNLVGALRSHLDKFLIVPILGFSVLGNYALGMQAFAVLIMSSGIVYKYVLAQDSRGISTKKIKQLNILLSVGIAVFGFFIGPLIISNIFPDYEKAIDVVQIMSISVIPATIGQMLMSKFLGQEKSRYVLFGRIISLSIMIPGIIILGTFYDIQGISIAYLLSTTGQAIFFFISNQKFLKT
jgi:O-antigen/teichoic acid export membrane protein|tara:strand:+ start:5094 stop:6248 length:1155 start_codon:yes stop_codon:yes gene_type:complete